MWSTHCFHGVYLTFKWKNWDIIKSTQYIKWCLRTSQRSRTGMTQSQQLMVMRCWIFLRVPCTWVKAHPSHRPPSERSHMTISYNEFTSVNQPIPSTWVLYMVINLKGGVRNIFIIIHMVLVSFNKILIDTNRDIEEYNMVLENTSSEANALNVREIPASTAVAGESWSAALFLGIFISGYFWGA